MENKRRPPSRKRQLAMRRRRRRRMLARLLRTIAVLLLVAALAALGAAVLLDHLFEKDVKPPRLYPMEYTAWIREYAEQQNLKPEYISAVILAESGYDPKAVSSVNAQGLMQIMPDTGEWIAGKLDEEYYEGCLFDPETNIRYGSWLLGYLMRRFDGNMACSSAAYHSGASKVEQWLENPQYSDDGKNLKLIPGENANLYVSRVLDYYEKYVEIYAGQEAA